MENRTEQFKENVAAFLFKLMDERGLSQKELATSIGVSPGRLNEYLTKKSLPRIKNILKISEFACVAIDSIIAGS